MKWKASVIRGKGRGKGLGFPTFNLAIPEKFDLAPGVYAAQVWIADVAYMGALHYGPIPTFQEELFSLEIFVLDYFSNRSIPCLEFEVKQYLREIRTFSSPHDLSEQIAADVQAVRERLEVEKSN